MSAVFAFAEASAVGEVDDLAIRTAGDGAGYVYLKSGRVFLEVVFGGDEGWGG